MEITYDYYRIFYYVATYQSFSKAAKILMSNQPNITRFINNLENFIFSTLSFFYKIKRAKNKHKSG